MGAPEARDDGGGREAELIVEAGGVPVGFLILAGLGTRVVELRRLAIAAPGRGYGRATIAWVVEHVFADPGVDRVWLDVVPRNARARRLYEAVGFTLDEIRADADIAPDGTRGPLAYYSLRRRAAPGQAGGARRAVGHAPRVQRSR
jgi:RimJ/RimL family protein N-acetyltransferase